MDALSAPIDAMPLLIVTVLGGWLLNGRLNRLEAKIDRSTGRVDGVELKNEGRPSHDEMAVGSIISSPQLIRSSTA